MAVYTTIDNPELYFQTKLYTGNGSTQSLTFDGSEDMQPDFLWFKQRDGTGTHAVFDSVRGTTGSVYRRLLPQDNGAEDTAANTLTAIGTDGFSISSDGNINGSSETMVAWCWKAGGSGSSNTDGSINTTSTSANTTSGFSIVAYTGDGNSSATLGHGLSSAPKVLINKTRSLSGYDWNVQHGALGATKYLYLSSNATEATNIGMWNNTAPTSSVFTVGTYDNVNKVSETYVTYCFSEVQGFSKFGSYYGNGSSSGSYIHLGFRASFILLKNTTTATRDWMMYDSKRQGYNGANNYIVANTNGSDQTGIEIDILSNGFKARSSATGLNASGVKHIYMAFAEAPFVNSKGVPCNAR